MAPRRGSSVVAPAKQKLRKNHGPKRHMFKDYKPLVHELAKAGLLTKYNNYESFVLSCSARGVKNNTREMWEIFKCLPRSKQDEYLKNIKENAIKVIEQINKRKRPAKKSA